MLERINIKNTGIIATILLLGLGLSTFYKVEQSDYATFSSTEKGKHSNSVLADSEPRFFGLGFYLHGLPNKYFDGGNTNIAPSKTLFSSLKQYSRVFYVRFQYAETGDYFSLENGKQFFMINDSHFLWRSTRNLGGNFNSDFEKNNVRSIHSNIGPADMDAMASRLSHSFTDLLLSEYRAYAKNNDWVISTIDEPEKGGATSRGENWAYTSETLEMLYERSHDYFETTGVKPSLVSVGLGPVADHRGQPRGNKVIYSKIHRENIPPNDLAVYNDPKYFQLDPSEWDWKSVLDTTMQYYAGTYDILQINSYAFTIAYPEKMGEIVARMISNTKGEKAIWPWISAEPSRYTNPDGNEAISNIRLQTFSAIANGASGVFFYPGPPHDSDQSEGLWQNALNVIKELYAFIPVLELGQMVGKWQSNNVELIAYQYNGRQYAFAVNHSNSTQNITFYTDGTPRTLNIDEKYAGIFHAHPETETFTKFTYPDNLTFNKYTSLPDNRQIDSQWVRSIGDAQNVQIYISGDSNVPDDNIIIGNHSLYLNDTSTSSTVAVERFIDIIPGTEIRLKGWNKHLSGNPQDLTIQFYDGSQWLSDQHAPNLNSNQPGEWHLRDTGFVPVPENATRAKIFIGTVSNSHLSEGYWDDISIESVGYL